MFQRFEEVIKNEVAAAVNQLYSTDVNAASVILQETKKEFEGDVTLVVFPYLKASGKNPEITAAEIGEKLKASSAPVSAYNVVKGFLNLIIEESYWKSFIGNVKDDGR